MARNTTVSGQRVNRRRILQGLGAAGTVAIAGCTGDDPDDDPAAPDDDDVDDADDDPETDEPDITFPIEVQLEVNAGNDDRVQMVELYAEALEQTGYFETSIETYEWNTYVERVMNPEYTWEEQTDELIIPCIGLSGTFNPESFYDALHHSENNGQCCNLVGVQDPELDELMESARFGMEVAQDPDLRRERSDEIWRYLAEASYSSITHFDLSTGVTNTDVHGFTMWPFNEGMLSFALFSPYDDQVMWIDRDSEATADVDIGDLQEGGELRVGVAAAIDSFDPPYSTDTTSTMAQSLVFEGLVATDSEGGLNPWLAEEWEIVDVQDIDRSAYEDYAVEDPDDPTIVETDAGSVTWDGAAEAVEDGVYGMQLQYSLREGVQFHDGSEMTAEDVIASYQYYEGSDNHAQTYDSVLYAEEVDDYTVNVYAQVPDAEAERELPGPVIMSADQLDELDEDGSLDPRQGHDPIGTGPYTFEEIEDEQFTEYSRFEDYWVSEMGVDAITDVPAGFPDGPVVEEISYEIIPDDATRSAALQNEEIDITYGLAADTLDDFDASDDFLVDGVETGGYEYFQYPLRREPFDDQRLRQACNHLVPREAIVENVLAGWARPAWTSLPELAHGLGTVDHDALEEEIRPYNEFDPQQAAALIEEVIQDRGYGSNV